MPGEAPLTMLTRISFIRRKAQTRRTRSSLVRCPSHASTSCQRPSPSRTRPVQYDGRGQRIGCVVAGLGTYRQQPGAGDQASA
jgi:hypothetical protein